MAVGWRTQTPTSAACFAGHAWKPLPRQAVPARMAHGHQTPRSRPVWEGIRRKAEPEGPRLPEGEVFAQRSGRARIRCNLGLTPYGLPGC
jgi:hypothetical protein